jgi:arylsulfatase A-like enzyme
LTTHHPGNHAVRTEQWRYIHYVNGDEELYDLESDPHEWKNLAEDLDYAEVKQQLAQFIPKTNAPYAPRLPRQKFTQDFDWSNP